MVLSLTFILYRYKDRLQEFDKEKETYQSRVHENYNIKGVRSIQIYNYVNSPPVETVAARMLRLMTKSWKIADRSPFVKMSAN